jgi:hypothetical protein
VLALVNKAVHFVAKFNDVKDSITCSINVTPDFSNASAPERYRLNITLQCKYPLLIPPGWKCTLHKFRCL